MLTVLQTRAATRTLRGWATSVLLEAALLDCASQACASRSIFHIKLNDNPCLPENAGKLCCARARGHNAQARFRGEDFIVTDDDSKTPQRTYQSDRDLQRRGVKIDDAIKGISDDDRKLIINKSLRKVNSALSVS
jgi:hypothetical protein